MKLLLRVVCILIGLALVAPWVVSASELLGPSPYLSFADSPFNGTGAYVYFHLENFEDASLTPGWSASAGARYGPASNCDSVDGDDGTINGCGAQGHSWLHGNGPAGVTFTFNAGVLGILPTHAGIVWTDGNGTIRFEAFDANGQSLGVLTGGHADASTSCTTGEDRFYGVRHAGGIRQIFIRNSAGGIEIDHLQYGFSQPIATEPTTWGRIKSLLSS